MIPTLYILRSCMNFTHIIAQTETVFSLEMHEIIVQIRIVYPKNMKTKQIIFHHQELYQELYGLHTL